MCLVPILNHLHLENGESNNHRLNILYKNQFIGNIEKKNPLRLVVKSSKYKNRRHPFWQIWASCFFCVLPISFVYYWATHKKQLFRGPSKEHSYQVWFQLTLWFQRRRLKCKSLRTTPSDAKWWLFLPRPYRWAKKLILFYLLWHQILIFLEQK